MIASLSNFFNNSNIRNFQSSTDTLTFRVISSIAVVVFTQIMGKVLENSIPKPFVVGLKVLPVVACSSWIIYKFFRSSKKDTTPFSVNQSDTTKKTHLGQFKNKHGNGKSPKLPNRSTSPAGRSFPFGGSPNKDIVIHNSPSNHQNSNPENNSSFMDRIYKADDEE